MLLTVFQNKNSISSDDNKLGGSFLYGKYVLDEHFTEIKLNQNEKKYTNGIASDGLNPQYCILVKHNEIIIDSEPFGISPLFLFRSDHKILISSSIPEILAEIEDVDKLEIDKSYILEQNLFNYSFSDRTIYSQIKLVPANTRVIITDDIEYKKVFSIEDSFISNPSSTSKKYSALVDLFLEKAKSKINDEDFISFTSGFDGRTLLGVANHFGKKIKTYSFGSSSNIDLTLPNIQAKKIGIPFTPIFLDSPHYENKFCELSKEVIKKSAANSNFLQIHWAYASEVLSNHTQRVVTGIFGSELFRAVHLPGQFSSAALINFFKHQDSEAWQSHIIHSKTLAHLNMSNFSSELNNLISELEDYRNTIKNLNPNQRFYKYVFDECFRKFFGMQFIQSLRTNLQVISPFLDLEFIKELLKTDLAGVNSNMFTNNPFERFKGQLFYSYLMKKTSKPIYKLKTGKGYSPCDLQNFIGKIKIGHAYFYKKLKKKTQTSDLDNLAILSGMKKCMPIFLSPGINETYYDAKYIDKVIKSQSWNSSILIRDKLAETLSTNYYIQKHND